jgi:hypothetical protein
LGANFDLPRVVLQITNNLSRLIDQIDGRLTLISYRLNPPSRKCQYIFVLVGPLVLIRDLDAFSEPVRKRHFRPPKKRLENFALVW